MDTQEKKNGNWFITESTFLSEKREDRSQQQVQSSRSLSPVKKYRLHMVQDSMASRKRLKLKNAITLEALEITSQSVESLRPASHSYDTPSLNVDASYASLYQSKSEHTFNLATQV